MIENSKSPRRPRGWSLDTITSAERLAPTKEEATGGEVAAARSPHRDVPGSPRVRSIGPHPAASQVLVRHANALELSSVRRISVRTCRRGPQIPLRPIRVLLLTARSALAHTLSRLASAGASSMIRRSYRCRHDDDGATGGGLPGTVRRRQERRDLPDADSDVRPLQVTLVEAGARSNGRPGRRGKPFP